MSQAAIHVPVIYCRDNPDVQRFVESRVRDFNPYQPPKSMRDILDAAIDEFGYFNCFWIEIQPH